MSSQLWNMTAIELARAIASREVSSREVESIERFERLVSAAIPEMIVTSP